MPTHLPTFVLIGAAKAATTSVTAYLRAHPDVFITDPREPNHFTGRGEYSDPDRYAALFDAAGAARARGEASTTYTRLASFPGVAARIRDAVPHVRLVYLVRPRMDRLRSHYLMHLRRGVTEGSFEDYVTRTDRHVDISCYGDQLDEYVAHFDSEQILVVWLGALAEDPAGVLARLAEHVGVDPEFYADFDASTRHNVAPRGLALRHVRVPAVLRAASSRLPGRWRHVAKSALPRQAVSDEELFLSPATRGALEERFADDQSRLDALIASTDIHEIRDSSRSTLEPGDHAGAS